MSRHSGSRRSRQPQVHPSRQRGRIPWQAGSTQVWRDYSRQTKVRQLQAGSAGRGRWQVAGGVYPEAGRTLPGRTGGR